MKKALNPTYISDIVGKIFQSDERDTVFSKHDLFRQLKDDNQVSLDYFEENQDDKKYYQKIEENLDLGSSGEIDSAFFDSQFWLLDKMSPIHFVYREFNKKHTEIDSKRTNEKIKEFSRFLGADLVGIGPLKQDWVYSNSGNTEGRRGRMEKWGSKIDLTQHKTAIALGFHMNYELMKTAPAFPEMIATAKGYADSARVSILIAETIRQWGFSARAHHFGNYQVLPVPIAVDCGLGELSRAGYLLTKEFGLALRLAVVTTDMPIEFDSPIDIGVQSFCEQCEICSQTCPVKAIPSGEKLEFNGIRKWKLDEKKCYSYWTVNNTDCGICMSVCPWTKPPTLFHKVIASIASIKGIHQKWLAWADRLVYGKRKPKKVPAFIDFDY